MNACNHAIETLELHNPYSPTLLNYNEEQSVHAATPKSIAKEDQELKAPLTQLKVCR